MSENIEDLIGIEVKYVGNTRLGLKEIPGVVERVSDTSHSVGIRYPAGVATQFKDKNGLVWGSRWAWTKVNIVGPPVVARTSRAGVMATRYGQTADSLDEVFTEAAGGTRAVLVNEIDRLTARLAKLREALEVIDSL